jgi:hypothetical protein
MNGVENITIFFTPVYPLQNAGFWGNTGTAIFAPAFGQFTGSQDAAAGVANSSNPTYRTLAVYGNNC